MKEYENHLKKTSLKWISVEAKKSQTCMNLNHIPTR
jgi:hypothetical protein